MAHGSGWSRRRYSTQARMAIGRSPGAARARGGNAGWIRRAVRRVAAIRRSRGARHSLRSASPARPAWAEPLDDLGVAALILGVSKLLPLGHVALNTPPGLVEPGKPFRRQRQGGQPAQVHDEGAGLAEVGGGLLVEGNHAKGQGRAGPRSAGGIGRKGGELLSAARRGYPGNREGVRCTQDAAGRAAPGSHARGRHTTRSRPPVTGARSTLPGERERGCKQAGTRHIVLVGVVVGADHNMLLV